MYNLDFQGNVGTKVGERAVTVRLGWKWYNRFLLGQIVQLRESADGGKTWHNAGTAKIVTSRSSCFDVLTAKMIEKAHDPACRTYTGLKAAMERLYGAAFSEGSVVSVLEFERLTEPKTYDIPVVAPWTPRVHVSGTTEAMMGREYRGEAYNIGPGDRVRIHYPSGHRASGVVTKVWRGKFRDVPAAELKHLTGERTYDGVLAERRAVDPLFGEDAETTMTTFIWE